MTVTPASLGVDSLNLPAQQRWVWFTPLILAAVLLAVSSYNFLLFHTLAELFAIIVAILLSVVAWQMYPFTRNNFLMYLGCGYFWIGVLDLVHTFSYENMNLLHFGGSNSSAQFWIFTRYMEVALLVTAPYFLNQSLHRTSIFVGFFLLSAVGFTWIVSGGFPTAFVDGVGLTPFKIYSEYLIVGMLLLAIAHLWKKKHLIEARILHIMIASMLFTMAAELAFTFYISVFGLSNLVGHIFKLFSYWLIFMAVIRTTLHEPFKAMARGASTYDAVPDATVILDSEGLIRQVNHAAAKLASKAVENLLGRHVHHIFHPSHIPLSVCPLCQAIQNNEAVASLELASTEQGRWYDYSLSTITGTEHMHGVVQVMRDVTQKRKALQAMREMDDQLRLLLDSTAEAIYGVDNKGLCTFANPACLRILGYEDMEEILGREMHQLIHHSHSSGEHYPVEDCKIYRAFREGKGAHVDDEVLWRKDGSSFPAEFWSYPIKKDGEVVGAVVTFLDISQRREAEQELHQYQDHLQELVDERTREMTAAYQELDAFSYSVSHDLRSPLRSIDGFSLALYEDYFETIDDSGKDYIQRIRKSVQRLGGLIDDLLNLSRITRQDMAREAVNMSAIAGDVVQEFRDLELVGKTQVKIQPGVQAWGDAKLIRIVLHNLFGNALKYSRDDAQPVLEFDCLENFEGHPQVFRVRDNGVGFDMKYAKSLFVPFQRLHGEAEFEGNGIGLATVKRIIQRHGGRLWADAKPGEGASFYFTLPN